MAKKSRGDDFKPGVAEWKKLVDSVSRMKEAK